MPDEHRASKGRKPARDGGSRGARGPLGPSAPPSDRPVQVGGEIRRAVQAELSRGLNDPRVQGMVSVTEVELTPDLSEARVFVSVLPEDRSSLTLSGLRAAAGFLRRRVMDETRIGRVPRLEFRLDERLKRQAALDGAIRDGASRDAAAGSAEGKEEADSARGEGNSVRRENDTP